MTPSYFEMQCTPASVPPVNDIACVLVFLSSPFAARGWGEMRRYARMC